MEHSRLGSMYLLQYLGKLITFFFLQFKSENGVCIETPPNLPVRLASFVVTPLVVDETIISFGPLAIPRMNGNSYILKEIPKVPEGARTPTAHHQEAVLEDLMLSSTEESSDDSVQCCD
jgi:hypothetical protein